MVYFEDGYLNNYTFNFLWVVVIFTLLALILKEEFQLIYKSINVFFAKNHKTYNMNLLNILSEISF